MWSNSTSQGEEQQVKVITTNGFRYVVPYNRRFHAYIKKRWFGKTLFEVLCSEFTVNSAEYYRSALSDGRIRLNGKVIGDDPIPLKNNDFFTHIVHCHEPPVFDVEDELEILTKQHQQKNGDVNDSQVMMAIPQDALESLVVVNKPASMPVHPCGRYNHNSLLSIVKKKLEQQSSTSTSTSTSSTSTSAIPTPAPSTESTPTQGSESSLSLQQYERIHQYKKRKNDKENNSGIELYPIHRLDRVTSGLVIFARDKKNATLMGKLLSSRDVDKVYLAKVVGRFPTSGVESTTNDANNSNGIDKSYDIVDNNDDTSGLVIVDAPILAKLKFAEEGLDVDDEDVTVVDGREGAEQAGETSQQHSEGDTHRNSLKGVIVHPNGQEAKTVFKRLSYDPVSNTSVVKCWPKTGRTHQIRIHLAHIGHPIVDDPHYNPMVTERRSKRRR